MMLKGIIFLRRLTRSLVMLMNFHYQAKDEQEKKRRILSTLIFGRVDEARDAQSSFDIFFSSCKYI